MKLDKIEQSRVGQKQTNEQKKKSKKGQETYRIRDTHISTPRNLIKTS